MGELDGRRKSIISGTESGRKEKKMFVHREKSDLNWLWIDGERICNMFFFTLPFGFSRGEKGASQRWWWHCMPFLEHQQFLSDSLVRSFVCLLARWLYLSSVSRSRFFFIGFDFIFVCTFNIEIAFWLGACAQLLDALYIGYCSRFVWSVTLRAQIFLLNH